MYSQLFMSLRAKSEKKTISIRAADYNILWHIKDVFLSQDDFIEYLLKGTKNLTPQFALQNSEIISQIINCSTAILLLSMRKCDIGPNPNPTVSSVFNSGSEQKQKYGTFCCSLVILHAFTSPGFVWRCPKDPWDNLSTAGFTRHRDICHQEPNRHNLSEQVRDVYLVQKTFASFLSFSKSCTPSTPQSQACWPQQCRAGFGERWRVYQTPIIFGTEVSARRAQQNHHSGLHHVIIISMYFHHFSCPLTKTLFYLDVYVLEQSPSIWWQHFRSRLQPRAQWWRNGNKAGKPDRAHRGTASLFLAQLVKQTDKI